MANNSSRQTSCNSGNRRIRTIGIAGTQKGAGRRRRDTAVVSLTKGKIKGWNHKEWGNEIPVDVPLKSAKADDFDALLLPGGVMNPDQLRMKPEAVSS